MSPAVLAGDTKKKTGDTRYRGRIAKSERTRDGHSEVLADHITDGQWRVTVCSLLCICKNINKAIINKLISKIEYPDRCDGIMPPVKGI